VQQYWIGFGDSARQVSLPPAECEIFEGVRWGRADAIDTPAYWALRCMAEEAALHGFVSESGSLLEEIGFCLLGGFGITAELNLAAFDRLRGARVFEETFEPSEDYIRSLLSRPLKVGSSDQRYRFPNQRARRLAAMRRRVRNVDLGQLPQTTLYDFLRRLDGIGPKTAAWIIRNHYDSDEVAILDVHVVRACSRLGVFPSKISLPRDYIALESRFLAFARALHVRPAVLDAVMWTEMRNESRSRPRLAA
jgi:thermostable 8-oxoguanine DNA glycosylase